MLNLNVAKVQDVIQEVAERVIVPRFRNLHACDIHFKGEDDPVTIADKEAEIELKTRLLDLLPGSNVVGEEAFSADSGLASLFLDKSPVWIIDPVDGTKAFVSGDPVYGVIVALAKQNQTIAGWLYDPTSKECVTAELGAGAWYKGKKLSVLPAAPLAAMQGLVGTRIRERMADPACGALLDGAPKIGRMLSACHDYASLVVGDPHFSRRLTQNHFYGTYCLCTPWDNAAGVLIHAEAGGYSAHWDGEPFRPSDYGKGLFSAPDKGSWYLLRDWVGAFCDLPRVRTH